MTEIKPKLQRYLYEESLRADKRFQQVHELYQEILSKIPEKGILFKNLKPLTKKLYSLYNDFEKVKEGNSVSIVNVPNKLIDDIENYKNNIPDKLFDMLKYRFGRDEINKPFDKAFYMKIEKFEINILKKDLILIFLPEEIKNYNSIIAGGFSPFDNYIFLYLEGLSTARTKKQVQELARNLGIRVLYHEFTHFVQYDELSLKLKNEIVQEFKKRFKIDINKKYQNKNIEIEAFSVETVIVYISKYGYDNFLEESRKNSSPYTMIKNNRPIYKLYKKMNKSSQKKVIKNVNNIIKYLRNNKKILEDISSNFNNEKMSSKFIDRVNEIIQEIYKNKEQVRN